MSYEIKSRKRKRTQVRMMIIIMSTPKKKERIKKMEVDERTQIEGNSSNTKKERTKTASVYSFISFDSS
jgi:hypothetical protein